MGSIPLEAAAGRDAGSFFEELVRGRSAHLFKLALLLTGQNQAEAGGRAMGYRAASLGARALGVPRLGRAVVSWLVAGSRESGASRMAGRP
jgi:hypothetical protein